MNYSIIDGVTITATGSHHNPTFTIILPENFTSAHYSRWKKRNASAIAKAKQNLKDKLEFVRFVTEVQKCTYDVTATSSRYNDTGIDYRAFHRPSSNGIGWVIIAPDEPANNWYTENPLVLSYLKLIFNK